MWAETEVIDNIQQRQRASQLIVEIPGGDLVRLGPYLGGLYEELQPASLAGGRVSGSGVGDYWGQIEVPGAGSVVVQVVPAVAPAPVHGVQNVQLTPAMAGISAYATNLTPTGFTLVSTGAGNFFWRAVVA